MKYSSLFNLIHSNTLSESVKEGILSKVLDRVAEADEDLLAESLNEGEDNISAYVETLSLLVNSDITNEALEEVIDTIFANESQETVDRVEEAFKEDVVKGILVEQLLIEEGLDEGWFDKKDTKPIGLAGIKRSNGEKVNYNKPQVQQQAPKKEPVKSTPFKGDKGVAVVKNADGTYRSANTSKVKTAAVLARKQRQQERINANKAKTEAKLKSTGSAEPIIDDTARLKKEAETKQRRAQAHDRVTTRINREERIKNNKAKTEAKLKSTGSAEPIVDDTPRLKKEARKKQLKEKFKQVVAKAKADGSLAKMVKGATEQRKERKGNGQTASNVRNSIAGGFKYSDAVQSKLDKVKGNKGATKAVENSNQATNERKDATKVTKKVDKSKTETTKTTDKPKPRRGRPAGSKNKPKEVVDTTKDSSKTETQSKPSVYIKGGNNTPKRKEENFDAPLLDQEIYTARKDALAARGTPKYAALAQKYNDLKAKKEAMNAKEALEILSKANISEATIKDICEMVAATKKNVKEVIKRNNKRLTTDLDEIHTKLEKTKQTDPELVAKAEEQLKHNEKTERRAVNKFGNL